MVQVIYLWRLSTGAASFSNELSAGLSDQGKQLQLAMANLQSPAAPAVTLTVFDHNPCDSLAVIMLTVLAASCRRARNAVSVSAGRSKGAGADDRSELWRGLSNVALGIRPEFAGHGQNVELELSKRLNSIRIGFLLRGCQPRMALSPSVRRDPAR